MTQREMLIVTNNYCVYMHIFPNGKRYIGLTGQNPITRWKRGKNYRNNIYMTRAVEKYGWDNIEHIIVRDGLSKQDAENLEISLIAKYKSNNPQYGYNISNGGECKGKLTEETRRKISEIRRAQCADPEYIKKLSLSHKGIPAHNKGVPMSEEQKRKVSLAKMGCEGHGKRKVLCVETGIIYASLAEATQKTGLNTGKICEVCKGTRHTTGGYHWQYAEV